jgi:hypothetical protein
MKLLVFFSLQGFHHKTDESCFSRSEIVEMPLYLVLFIEILFMFRFIDVGGFNETTCGSKRFCKLKPIMSPECQV